MGRIMAEHGAPLKMCELLNQLDGPAFIARVAIGSEKQTLDTRRTIARAIENQIHGRGYSFVEILSPCPSNWHCSPEEARDRTANEMTAAFPLGIFRDVSKESVIRDRFRPAAYDPTIVRPPYEALAKPVNASRDEPFHLDRLMSVCCAGFGGQGILTLGKLIARLALAANLEATWIPSYGPEMRGGTANCFVCIDRQKISSPIVEHPDVVLAFNQPALDRFGPALKDDGFLIYDCDAASPHDGQTNAKGIPATTLAATCNAPKSANLVMLGAWLKSIHANPDAILRILTPDLKPEQINAIQKGFASI